LFHTSNVLPAQNKKVDRTGTVADPEKYLSPTGTSERNEECSTPYDVHLRTETVNDNFPTLNPEP